MNVEVRHMEKIDIIFWILGIGFSFNFGLMIIIWGNLGKRIDKLDEKVTDIDRRLCRLEGAFSSKECCMLVEDRHAKKAE
jgi:hypothetical protein